MAGLSPMMQHCVEAEKQCHDYTLFYRLGDFYEMFFEDAITVARELEITLTGKKCGLEEHAPMYGVPYHAVDTHLNRLMQKGYKAVIAEQVENPKLAKGPVKREVIRVVTPGTITSVQALGETKNNYPMGIVYPGDMFGVAAADISTGDFLVTETQNERELWDEVHEFTSSEIICNEAFYMSGIDLEELKIRCHVMISPLDDRFLSDDPCRRTLREHYRAGSLDGLGLADYDSGMITAGAVMQYLYETQKSTLEYIATIPPYTTGKFMIIDLSTRQSLELVETMREEQKQGTLLWMLDKTKTAIEAELLCTCIERPLVHKAQILECQEAAEEPNNSYINRGEICEYLNPIYDLEQLIGRISYKTANPKDLITSHDSLEILPRTKNLLGEFRSLLLGRLYEELDTLEDMYDLIFHSIEEEPPVTARDGDIIKDGYSEEVDRLCHIRTEGRTWLTGLEAKEWERTGIKGLKIRFDEVFGYHFEVTNSFKGIVLDYSTRKQALANAERYTTSELEELEETIMGAGDKLFSPEYSLFYETRDSIGVEVLQIQKAVRAIAGIDVPAFLSVVTTRNDYVKLSINKKREIHAKSGHYPVVELMLREDLFMANDTLLDNQKNRAPIITGSNMVGKSTYVRQTALIALMTRLGSFVPANETDIGFCNGVFTRVGASDDLASDQNTFMVKMMEVTNILRNATKDSLVILDEIGRGTSIFGRLGITRAVVEHISDTKVLGAKTLFATHCHGLMKLKGIINGVTNYYIAAKEQGDDMVFLRKIIKNGADKSYNIQMAKLAGVPDAITGRTRELAEELSSAGITARTEEIAQQNAGVVAKKMVVRPDEVDTLQMLIFGTAKGDDTIKKIEDVDISNMTSFGTLTFLNQTQNKLKNRRQVYKT